MSSRRTARRGAQLARDEGGYQPDVTGQRSVAADETGYGQQRFVPPYVRAQPDSSEAGYLDDSEYRLPADPGGRYATFGGPAQRRATRS